MTSFPPGGDEAMAGDYTRVVDTQAELAILESRLPEAWPNKSTLRPYLEKLLANPGSMVFIALEAPRGPEGPTIGMGWFSAQERAVLRKALLAVNARRQKKVQLATD